MLLLGSLFISIIEFKKKHNLKYKAKNAYNQDIEIYVPTVFVIDSLTQMPSQTVYEEEKQNPTDALHQAGAIDKLFKLYRGVVEGTHYIQGGEIFSKEKSLDELSLEECQLKLQEAIDNEDYELAEKIKNIMQKFA